MNLTSSTEKTIADLRPAPYNPRKISDKKLAMLSKAMKEFGDLSGIVFNRQTGNLIGGHQRVKIFNPEWPISKKKIKDNVGTIAEGHIETPYGRWIYREVDWSLKKEMAANIAANKHGGEWDFPLLSEALIELDTGEFDMELTGFDELELEQLMIFSPKEKEVDENIETDNECPKCGYKWS